MWLLILLLGQLPNVTGTWVGPLQMTVHAPKDARGAVPTIVELQQTGSQITGRWRSLPPNTLSGTITGTADKWRIVFYTDSEAEPERCQAEMDAKAILSPANIYRIEARKMIPDTRPKKACGPWPTDLVWLIQRH